MSLDGTLVRDVWRQPADITLRSVSDARYTAYDFVVTRCGHFVSCRRLLRQDEIQSRCSLLTRRNTPGTFYIGAG